MRIKNPTGWTRRYLDAIGLAEMSDIELPDDQLSSAIMEACEQHPEESSNQLEARAIARLAWKLSRKSPVQAPPKWRKYVIAWAVAVLILLGVIAVRADTTEDRLGVIHRAMVNTPQFDSPIIILESGLSQLAVVPAGKLILNCSTNMSCTWNSTTRRFDLTASSTAATAWSAITSGTNANAGSFIATGNTWDWTGVTLFKLRVGAGCTTSANGDLCFDSTASRWKIWQVANRELIASTNVGTSGQPCLSNADGSCTFADPIVSGPAAEGATPVNNPVWVAGTGTDGFIRALRLFDLDSGAGAQWAQGVNLRKIASGGSVEAGTATDPLRTDPTGTTTQPVSGTVTANQGTANATPWNENIAQINGVAPLMGNGVTGTGSPRVSVASDNSNAPGIGGSATGSAPPSAAQYMGANSGGATGGLLAGVISCNSSAAISTAASGSTEIVALTASQTIYICGYNWMANGTVNVKLVYGTGASCATGPTDLTGAYNHTAQTGIAVTSPFWTGIKTASANALCINLSAAIQVSGVVMYTKF